MNDEASQLLLGYLSSEYFARMREGTLYPTSSDGPHDTDTYHRVASDVFDLAGQLPDGMLRWILREVTVFCLDGSYFTKDGCSEAGPDATVNDGKLVDDTDTVEQRTWRSEMGTTGDPIHRAIEVLSNTPDIKALAMAVDVLQDLLADRRETGK